MLEVFEIVGELTLWCVTLGRHKPRWTGEGELGGASSFYLGIVVVMLIAGLVGVLLGR